MIRRLFVLALALSVMVLPAAAAFAQAPGSGSCINGGDCGNPGQGVGPPDKKSDSSERLGPVGNTGGGNQGNQFGNGNKNYFKGNAGCDPTYDSACGDDGLPG
jgi:hypothetical protein